MLNSTDSITWGAVGFGTGGAKSERFLLDSGADLRRLVAVRQRSTFTMALVLARVEAALTLDCYVRFRSAWLGRP